MTSPSSADSAPAMTGTAATPTTARIATRPRTLRRDQLLRLASALILVVIAAAWLLPSLGPGSAGVASGPPGSDIDTDPPSRAAIISYVPSGRVAVGVEVRNTTFVPVTIVGLPDGSGLPLQDVHLVLGQGAVLGLEDDQTRPFQAITLQPGASQLIGLVGRFPDCAGVRPNWADGTSATIASLRLDVRVAGLLPANADVLLMQPVELRGRANEACPTP